jgi:hypothetical protein
MMMRMNGMKHMNRMTRTAALALAALLILLVPGCGMLSDMAEKAGFSVQPSGSAAASDSGGSTSDTGGDATSDTIDAAVLDLPSLSEIDAMKVEVGDTPAQQPAISPSNLLGSISFTPDETRSAQGDYEPDKSLVLEATDGGGFTWRLEIPEGADYQAQTITMTPLRDFKSDVPGAVSSGVRLEPDGLNFLKPVLLSVEGPGIGNDTVLLSGDHSGGNLGFIPLSKNAEGLCAEIWHFSSSFSFDSDPKIKTLMDKVRQERKAAIEAASWMVRQPIRAPIPPDLSYRCKDDSCEGPDTKELDKFIKQFLEPEIFYLRELINLDRTYQILYGITATEHGFSDSNVSMLIERLTYRYIRKLNELIMLHKYRPEKCMAVMSAAYDAIKSHKIFGFDFDESEIIETMIHWHKRTFEHYLAELRDKHDFKAFHAMFRVARNAALLGADNQELVDKMENAMHFTVKFKNSLTGQGASYNLSGAIDVLQKVLYPEADIFPGSGKGEYNSVEIPYGKMKLPNDFPVNAGVARFDTCKAESVVVYIDRFGAENETYIADGIPVTTVGAVDKTTKAFLYDMVELSSLPLSGGTDTTCYKFILPFQNGKEIIAEKTFSRDMGMQLIYTLEVWHTPK